MIIALFPNSAYNINAIVSFKMCQHQESLCREGKFGFESLDKGFADVFFLVPFVMCLTWPFLSFLLAGRCQTGCR